MADAAHEAGGKVKVVFENCYLSHDWNVRACEICKVEEMKTCG